MSEENGKKRRGFAVMSREAVSAIARKGGVAAHKAGTAHEFTQDEAREAGRKGGLATRNRKMLERRASQERVSQGASSLPLEKE